MKNKLLIPAMITAFILGLLVTEIVCKPEVIVKKKSVRKQWTRTKPLAATIHYSDTTYIKMFFPDTIWQVITKHDTIYKTLQDYFAYVNVKDTIDLDSVGIVYLNDSLHMNRIIHRDYTADVNYYTKIYKNNFNAFCGVFMGAFDKTPVLGIDLTAQLKKNAIDIKIGTNNTYILTYKRIVFER